MSAAATPNGRGNKQQAPIAEELMDDLSARFVINMPKEQRRDVIRVMFQVELAHWHYIDLIAVPESRLPRPNLTEFTRLMFQHISRGEKQNDFKYLKKKVAEVEDVIAEFKAYKSKVPTYGAIVLDSSLTKCLMVQGFSGNGWGFPKGKINDSEDPIHCAIRELKEETGFDCEQLVNENDIIRKCFKGTEMVLYIVSGVDQNHVFRAECRNEIRHIKWFEIESLPVDFESGKASNTFYMAIPFISDLKDWIALRAIPDPPVRPSISSAMERLLPAVRVVKKSDSRPQDRHSFWTKVWDKVSLDWGSIWSEVDAELAVVNG